jgi:hypothetical protein
LAQPATASYLVSAVGVVGIVVAPSELVAVIASVASGDARSPRPRGQEIEGRATLSFA